MIIKISIALFALCCLSRRHDCPHYYHPLLKKDVYTKVEIEPEFPGGAAAYMRFLNRHLRLPKDMDISELVNLSAMSNMKFIVDTTGQIINPAVHDKTDTAQLNPFEKEVLRLIRLMPNWVPGFCGDKKVAAEVNRPLVICLRLETEE
jgi:hypothetical protein